MMVEVHDAVQVRSELVERLRAGGLVCVARPGFGELGLGEGIWLGKDGRVEAVVFDLGWAWRYLGDHWAWPLGGQAFLDWLAGVLVGLGLGRYELGQDLGGREFGLSEPLGAVIWQCPFFRLGGYGIEGTIWASVLVHRADLYLRPQGSIAGLGLGFERDWLATYCRDWRVGEKRAFILNHTPEVRSYLWGQAPAVGRVMFETGGVPSEWLGYLNRMEELWVPTEWGCSVFGRVHRRVKCLASPIDIDVNYPVERVSGDRVRFGTVTDLHSRKNLTGLLRAFALAFGPGDEVELWLRIFSIYHRDEEAERMVRSYVRDGLNRSDLLDRIVVVTGVLGNRALADFYRGLDWYVSLSRGEGFDRPAVEALACGCGLVLSDNTAHSELVPRDWSYWVPCVAVPVPELVVRLEYRSAAGHEWYEPDLDVSVEALRSAYRSGTRVSLDEAWARWDWVRTNYGKYVVADRWLELAETFWR